MPPFVEEIKKQDIVDQLTWDDSVNANDVHVIIKDKTVQLKGTVPNYTAKLSAERAAYQVVGVNQVENYLEVAFPPSVTMPDDEDISDSIVNTLSWNTDVRSDDIMVKTRNGIVTLSGHVSSYWEKYLAGRIAVTTNGVIEVINDLAVTPTRSVIDMDIEKDIRNAYRRSGLIDEDKIHVSAKNGIVHLEGVVSSYLIKQRAHDIAMYTAGVVDVVDHVTVG
jgi:osmotically-inducible protein OsmY